MSISAVSAETIQNHIDEYDQQIARLEGYKSEILELSAKRAALMLLLSNDTVLVEPVA